MASYWREMVEKRVVRILNCFGLQLDFLKSGQLNFYL
jgi:hypothetical protein